MRFSEFLRTTVLLSAASASLLAVLTVLTAVANADTLVMGLALAWWVLAGVTGTAIGRRDATSGPIASLLAAARTQASLPEVHPARTILNRLWPLLVCTIAAGALSFVAPQISAIAAGFAIIWSLSWRRQPHAVIAIEERDGARFYVEQTSPLQSIRLVRTPGFRTNLMEFNGSTQPGHARPRV